MRYFKVKLQNSLSDRTVIMFLQKLFHLGGQFIQRQNKGFDAPQHLIVFTLFFIDEELSVTTLKQRTHFFVVTPHDLF